MLRAWSEHLPYEEAMDPGVIRALEQSALHPIFAVHPEADLDRLAELLLALPPALSVGLWPLLPDEQGYWPGERNAEAYFARVAEILGFLGARDIAPSWLAVDLEPPLHQVEALRARQGAEAPWALYGALRENLDRERFNESARAYESWRAALYQSHPDLKTLAVTLPMAAHDLSDGEPLWQDALEAPWAAPRWDRLGVMAYGSMVAGYSNGWLDYEDARAIHSRLAMRLIAAFGSRAHVSLGAAGVGKLKDEPVYARREELASDVAAMRAVGVEDLAVFCLEGLLARHDAGAWITALSQAGRCEAPMTWRASTLRLGAYAARAALRRLALK